MRNYGKDYKKLLKKKKKDAEKMLNTLQTQKSMRKFMIKHLQKKKNDKKYLVTMKQHSLSLHCMVS